jgi:hypothetical protein
MATTDFDAVAVHTADGLTVGGAIVSQSEHVTTVMVLNSAVVNQACFVAARAWQVMGAQESHATAGNDAGAVTLQLEKLTGTTAPGSGTALLTDNSNAGFNLKGTANTVQTGTLTGTVGSLQLAVGDRLAWKVAGTPTAVVGVVASVRLKAI